MIREFITYNNTTGAITGKHSMQGGVMEPKAPAGQSVLEVPIGDVDELAQYVSGGELVPRIATGATPDTLTVSPGSPVTWSSVPVGTHFRVITSDADHEITVDDGELVVVPDTPGRFIVEVQNAQYLPERWEINCQ